MRWLRVPVMGLLALLALAACEAVPIETPASPPAEPDVPVTAAPAAARPTGPSAASLSLSRYYARVQADLLAQGLLRTGGGGPDTPYTDTDLLRNFETIAFYDEHTQGSGFRRASGVAGGLRKWTGPVRITTGFGSSVSEAQRNADRAMVRAYAARLGRVTGHPILASDARPNFHVLFMGEDDRDETIAMIQRITPNISASALSLFRSMPRSIHCFVLAFAGTENDYAYSRAIAFIRAEHPPLLRQSCVHEEIAQGLGLANDSPRARPSIFNDDDEFALLTTHDEELLRLLYNPALRPGMSADQARPIISNILAGRGGPI